MIDLKTQQAIADAFTGMTQAEQDKMMAVLDSMRTGSDGDMDDETYYTNVTQAMQAAGWSPVKRAKAGVKAWVNNKTASTRGAGVHSRTSARWMRFFGMRRTADFMDRWMTGPKPKKGTKSKTPKSTTSTGSSTSSGESSLVAFKKQLDYVTV